MSFMHERFWLVNCLYDEEKRQIVSEYANCKRSIIDRHAFHPFLFISKKAIDEKALNDLRHSFDSRKILLEECRHSFKISASTFSDLKAFASLLKAAFSIQVHLMDAERQFLLSGKKSFFDEFVLIDSSLLKLNEAFIPEARLETGELSLRDELTVLIKKDEGRALGLAKTIFLSRFLAVHPRVLPESRKELAEKFLEKLFFENSFAAFSGNELKKEFSQEQVKGSFDSLTEIDFSEVWPKLLSFPFHNLGFDTINCSCCTPSGILSNNVSLQSFASVSFKRNAFYFDSMLDSFAKSFHESMPGKEKRINRKKEFCLKNYPIGPFNRHEKALVPLVDAINLLDEGSIELNASGHELNWFCNASESFLSKALNDLKAGALRLERKKALMQKEFLEKYNLLSEKLLQNNMVYLFNEASIEALNGLLSFIPLQLSSQDSKFYSRLIANEIKAIQAELLQKFREFSLNRKEKVIASNSLTAFVDSKNPLSLAEAFAEKNKVPMPSVKRKWDLITFA